MVTKWEKLHFGRRKGRQSPASAKKRKKKKKTLPAIMQVQWFHGGKSIPIKKYKSIILLCRYFAVLSAWMQFLVLKFFLSLSYLPLSLCCSPLHGLSFLLLSSAAEGAALKGQGMLCTYIRARGCFENPQGKGEGPKQGALAEPP